MNRLAATQILLSVVATLVASVTLLSATASIIVA